MTADGIAGEYALDAPPPVNLSLARDLCFSDQSSGWAAEPYQDLRVTVLNKKIISLATDKQGLVTDQRIGVGATRQEFQSLYHGRPFKELNGDGGKNKDYILDGSESHRMRFKFRDDKITEIVVELPKPQPPIRLCG